MGRVTQPIVRFGIYDVTAKGEAAYSGGNLLATNDYEVLRRDVYEPLLYATGEHNMLLLNGDRGFPREADTPQRPVYSSVLSDSAGLVPAGTFLLATFTTPHTSTGITLVGDERTQTWANKVLIEWMDSGGTVISSETFEPDRVTYFASNLVANYYRVRVTFQRTNKPLVRVPLLGIRYGQEYIFASNELQRAEVVLEMSPISEVVIAGQFNFTSISRASSFDIFNSTGQFQVVQVGQKVVVSEMIDGVQKQIGVFYLNNWDFSSGVVLSFNCVDKLGMLEKDDSVGGLFTNSTLTATVNALFAGMDVDIYVHPTLASVPISGWFPIANYRAQLQFLAFSIGATVFVDPEGSIHIQPLARDIKAFIQPDRKFVGQTIERRKEFTDIDVTSYGYYTGGQRSEMLRETYTPGIYTVFFDGPVYAFTITGASIVSSNVNHLRFNVTTAGEVTVTATAYIQKMETARASRITPLPGGARTFLNAEGCTALSSNTAAYMAQYVYDYYALSQKINFTAVLEEEVIGDLVQVTLDENTSILGTISGMRINLIGLVTDFTVVGALLDMREGDTMWRIPFYSNERAVT